MIGKEEKIVVYENECSQAFFEDGTVLSWRGNSITYFSAKGNKIRLSLESIHHSQDVSLKLARVIKVLNIYNDHYIEPSDHLIPLIQPTTRFKKYKIQQYFWEQAVVKSTETGFEVTSDDLNAKLQLSKNLYQVQVCYLQRTSRKKMSEEQTYLHAKNPKKQLLEKYSYKYTEFSLCPSSNDLQLQYHELTKQFTIFNLPKRWYPAIKLVWSYLLSNELIPHPFCYIDFSESQNKDIDSIVMTKMPQCLSIIPKGQEHQSEYQSSLIAFPLYGKPNHNYKCKWIYIVKDHLQIIAHLLEDGSNVLVENNGFWFIEEGKASFKSKNRPENDYQVNLKVFPYTVRIQGQPERDIKSHIFAFHAYLSHREMLTNKEIAEPSKRESKKAQDLIQEQALENIGVFRAYGNGMAVGKFVDRVIMTMQNNGVSVIDSQGKSSFINLDSPQPTIFTDHISYLSNFYQRIFFPQAFESRMALNSMLQERQHRSQLFMKVIQHMQSK